MQRNLASWDRWVRAIVGIVLVVLGGWTWYGWQGTWYGVLSIIVGAVLFVTALVGWCPGYWVCKFSTAQKAQK